MKGFRIGLLSLFGFFLLVTVRGEDEIDVAIRQRLGGLTQEDQDLSWISGELRPVVLQRLLEEWNRSRGDRRREAELRLVSLGHPGTLGRLADEMKQGNQWNALEWSATEDSIPYLMDVVRSGSVVHPGFGDGDVYVYSPRARAAGMIVEILRSRSAFPEATRSWASTLEVQSHATSTDEDFHSLNSWWENNQEAILAKRFSEASWLPRSKAGLQKGPVVLFAAAFLTLLLILGFWKTRTARH